MVNVVKERHWIYFFTSTVILTICLYLLWEPTKGKPFVLGALITCSLLTLTLLLDILEKNQSWGTISLSGSLVIMAWVYGVGALPVCAVLFTEIIERTSMKAYCTYISGVAVLLAMLITNPPPYIIIITVLALFLFFVIIYILNKLYISRNLNEDKEQKITELEKKLEKQRKLVASTEYATKIKERNRIAGKIHDKLGHGISGSILLLEGAMLMFHKDEEKTKETIMQATNNLRESVDGIRTSLREERSSQSDAGLAEIKNELSKLSASHAHIKTTLKTEGELDFINPAIWFCIYENTKEAIFNMLKHSDATAFSVSITNQNKLVKAEIRDNGSVKEFKTDIGLQAMEERCAMNNGHCFFRGDASGFKIIMTFRNDHSWRKENTI